MEYTTRLAERVAEEAADNPQWYAILDIWRDIERASRHVQIEWPGLISEWEEIQQEIIALLVQDKYATKARALDPKPRKQLLFKMGTRIASQMAADYDHFMGNYHYSTHEVRRLLEQGALDSVVEETVEVSDSESPEESVGMAVKVETFDIKACLPQLTEAQRKILVRRYQKDVLLTAAERMRVTEAVDALTQYMNRAFRTSTDEHQGPGARSVLSNSQAVSRTKNQENTG